MAKFKMELPTDIMKDIKYIENNSDKIFGEMTKAGAQTVLSNVKANAPLSELSSHAKLTKIYKTPTDDGINTKVIMTGYIPFSTPNRKYFTRRGGNGRFYSTDKGVPVDFLVKLYEYGRSTRSFPKKPFFRKSFNKAQIERAMLNAQKQYSKGLLK